MESLDYIKGAVEEVLPTISAESASVIAERLIDDAGVENIEDLKFVQPEDLCMLKPIQVRKLIQAWQDKEGKCLHVSIECSDCSHLDYRIKLPVVKRSLYTGYQVSIINCHIRLPL